MLISQTYSGVALSVLVCHCASHLVSHSSYKLVKHCGKVPCLGIAALAALAGEVEELAP